jgi:hypothetical protein
MKCSEGQRYLSFLFIEALAINHCFFFDSTQPYAVGSSFFNPLAPELNAWCDVQQTGM